MEIQHDYLQDTLPSEHEYNPFQDSMNQYSSEEFETLYNKGNYRNYAQKYNHQNRQTHQTFKPRTPVHYNNRKQQQPKARRNKNPCDKNGTQLRCYICQSIYHMT